MILVFGAIVDSGIGHIVHRLTDRQVPFFLLDPRELGRSYHLGWEWRRGRFHAWLTQDGSVTSLDDVQSAYVHHVADMTPDSHDDADTKLARNDTYWLLSAFVETAPILVCNRPLACATNYSKPWQQQVITGQGFATPRTLVTNIPDQAREFYVRCRRRVIYKSVSSRRSIVQRMTDADLDRLELLRSGPVQFQEWLPGTDIRVHVMGRKVYATEITTDATDYRYADREAKPRIMRGIQLPAALEERCLNLTKALGLVSSGVDLRKTPDGRYFCFEANPRPAFGFYEQFTGQRIADGLIDALLDL